MAAQLADQCESGTASSASKKSKASTGASHSTSGQRLMALPGNARSVKNHPSTHDHDQQNDAIHSEQNATAREMVCVSEDLGVNKQIADP
jgi:hypothetical protein